MEKYRLLRQKLLAEKYLHPKQIRQAPEIELEDLLRAHTADYVYGLKNNTLSEKQLKPIGLPWSEALWKRSLTSVGGFVAACETALTLGLSGCLAGGTHHAHADRGEGYCVFNDFAVAALKLLQQKKIKHLLILDLDVHQGNGNSSLLGQHPQVFICSIHGRDNYPFRKVASHLDVALEKGCDDTTYLKHLDKVLLQLSEHPFDFVMYQAGVDVLKEDVLGTFHLSQEGIFTRDKKVLSWCFEKRIPLAFAIGGGYSRPLEHTLDAYTQLFRAAQIVYSAPE
jgi:acetoin utilization deacetylase AcuC-like enzyme